MRIPPPRTGARSLRGNHSRRDAYPDRMTRLIALLALFTLAACNRIEEATFRARGETPHEDYVEALRAAGLADAAVGRDWMAAAERALHTALPAEVPLQEVGYFDAAAPAAVALRVALRRGQRITVAAELAPASDAQLFVDVFRIPDDTTAAPRHVAAADSGTATLEYEPSRTGDYLVRVQPELLRGGRYRITVGTAPTLSFPVEGVGERAIGSAFGAPRDRGARDHHGIDIFAPRGTPVLASVAGVVNRVQETPRGGRVVWLRDERRGQSIYYAHLDRQLVTSGERVAPGDTIGTVGNTGNARTTPPHLHFGVYRRGEGPLDPYWFVASAPRAVAELRADTSLLGTLARTTRRTSLRSGDVLEEDVVVEVVGAHGADYRVALPDGRTGWLAASAVRDVDEAARLTQLPAGCAVRDRPVPHAAVRVELADASRAAVLGAFGDYELVRADTITGWADCA